MLRAVMVGLVPLLSGLGLVDGANGLASTGFLKSPVESKLGLTRGVPPHFSSCPDLFRASTSCGIKV